MRCVGGVCVAWPLEWGVRFLGVAWTLGVGCERCGGGVRRGVDPGAAREVGGGDACVIRLRGGARGVQRGRPACCGSRVGWVRRGLIRWLGASSGVAGGETRHGGTPGVPPLDTSVR